MLRNSILTTVMIGGGAILAAFTSTGERGGLPSNCTCNTSNNNVVVSNVSLGPCGGAGGIVVDEEWEAPIEVCMPIVKVNCSKCCPTNKEAYFACTSTWLSDCIENVDCRARCCDGNGAVLDSSPSPFCPERRNEFIRCNNPMP